MPDELRCFWLNMIDHGDTGGTEKEAVPLYYVAPSIKVELLEETGIKSTPFA